MSPMLNLLQLIPRPRYLKRLVFILYSQGTNCIPIPHKNFCFGKSYLELYIEKVVENLDICLIFLLAEDAREMQKKKILEGKSQIQWKTV